MRLAGAISAVSCIAVTLLTAVSASPGRAAASIGSDKNSIRQLEQLIAHEGDVVQSLVTRADRLEAQLAVTRRHIASARAHLAADRHSVAGARQHLRALAIDAYVDASAAPGSVFQAGSATSADEQQVYLGVASGNIDEAVAALQSDEHRTSVAEGVLKAEDVELTASLQRVGAAQRKAQAAIDEDEAILSHVKGNLLSLVLAANERREAAAEEAEEAQEAKEQAAEAAQNTPPPAPTPTPPPKAPSPPKRPKPKPPAPPPPAPTGGGYANPLRAINALSPERVDQGVDYSGYGPIYAVGDGVVVNTVNGGWPGGTFIVYQLTSGRGAGLFVYAAEDIDPAVSIGEDVTPNTVLGQMYEGPDGIETGWADGSALGETMAAEYGQFDGSNSTAFGYNFSQLLESVGAPGGILQNNPPTGSLPSGWPQW